MMKISRRQLLAAGPTVILAAPMGMNSLSAQPAGGPGRLRQSVARWCFNSIPINAFCEHLREMGITGMDLVGPDDWATCKRYGITPSMVQGAGTFLPAPAGSGRRFGPSFGWNRPEHHGELIATARSNIDLAAAAGLPNIISLFGDRREMSDEEGIAHCVTGLKQIAPYLEANNVALGLELLNSKIDHPDYQGDNTQFGVEVCRRTGSPNIRLVYDAYHMQIMEGNLINTIRDNIEYFCHIHVAGVPGRHEIDNSQEVNWKAIARTIADLGFTGYVSHEWIPSRPDPITALREAVGIMTV